MHEDLMSLEPPVGTLSEEYWRTLDATVAAEWDKYLVSATEDAVRSAHDVGAQLLFLPFPYHAPFAEGVRAMFAWDTYFINRALLAHGRFDLVRNHISNYLLMIDRFGFMPNASLAQLATRSQTPVFPESIWRYFVATDDLEMLYRAYPLLKREYLAYWNAPHHATPTGLATNRDLGDGRLSAEYAAEAETGLDWTPIFGGDVRACVPLITNCALVTYARVLECIAEAIDRKTESIEYRDAADQRAELIRKYCWNETQGIFAEYDFVRGRQLPYISDCTYWPMWSRAATSDQAARLERNINVLERRYGIACTARAYDDPHKEPPNYDEGRLSDAVEGAGGQLQWMYPAGWACMQVITVEALDAYGFSATAERVARRFLEVILRQHRRTGKLWEKYNVVDGTLSLPNSRYGNASFPTSWTTAAAVLFGRRVFLGELLEQDAAVGRVPIG
jgi:alpha,alpha-trehalase